MSFTESLWAGIWWVFTAFIFVAYLMVLFGIIVDLFRDRRLGGLAKAIWILFLVFFPFITALVYLIARGRGMNERSEEHRRDAQRATSEYIRSVAGTGSGPAEEISLAKKLLDDGTISQEEFDRIKTSALAAE